MPKKIAKEVAEKEFEKLCAERHIETDLTDFTDVEKLQFGVRKARILRLMMAGSLVLEEKTKDPLYTPQVTKSEAGEALPALRFHRATAAVLMEGDQTNGPVERLLAMATALTKSPDGYLAKFEVPDFRAVDEVTAFLIGR